MTARVAIATCSTATCTRKAEPGMAICRACLDRLLWAWGVRTGQAWVDGLVKALGTVSGAAR